METAPAVWLPVVLFLWAIMYVLVVLVSRIMYAEAVRRGQNAELWVLINVVTGLTGLLLILTSLLARDARGVWLFTILGALLVVLGPLIYLALPKPRGGGGAGR